MADFTYRWFALITAENWDVSVEEVEPWIDRSKVEAARAAAFGGPDEIVLYPEPVRQAAVFCAELIRLRPLVKDNKEVAFNCMREVLTHYEWTRFDATRPEISKKLDELDDVAMVPEFVRWVRERVGP